MSFGSRLNETRKRRKLAAKIVAEHIDVNLRSYRAYESDDREPSFATLVKLAKFLGVSTDYLLEMDEPLSELSD